MTLDEIISNYDLAEKALIEYDSRLRNELDLIIDLAVYYFVDEKFKGHVILPIKIKADERLINGKINTNTRKTIKSDD